MPSIRIILLACVLGNFVLCTICKDEEKHLLFDKLRKVGLKTKQLIFENFKKNVFTVPEYSSKEAVNPTDPPFNPTPECGDQFLNLTEGAFGAITSPLYPEYYPADLQCEWIIESIPGTVVEGTFFDVKTQPWLFSFSDYVLVSVNGEWINYRRFAGDANSQMPFTFISKENRLVIRFVSSHWLSFRGFKMAYVVRPMKPSDDVPPENEYGSAFNNDLVAVCSSRPIGAERINTKYPKEISELIQRSVSINSTKIVKIVNGVDTMPHQYPFVVAILADESLFCTGSLIDEFHVLTAAHCIDKATRIDLFFGVYNMTNRAENWYARQARTIEFPDIASRVFMHPNYEEESGSHDIAILRVPKVKITKYVQPIFLPSVYSMSNSFTGWNLKTLGWGATKEATDEEMFKITPVLKEAAATVITSSECRATFQGSVTGNNICTRTPKLKPVVDTPPVNETESQESSDVESVEIVEYESPCHGDSGGPLFAEFAEARNDVGEDGGLNLNEAGASSHECVNAKANGSGFSDSIRQPDTVCQRPKDSNERWYIITGVLSFGSRVCGKDVPIVYTRVTAYLQWIAYITGRHG